MKKLVNDPRRVVREMLEGIAGTNAGVALLEDADVLLRADLPAETAAREVAIVSGGGAGHEPAHAGYVGAGMLHAAVTGDVFTSPSVDAVLAAIRAVGGPAGVLLVVKNYTGDRLNFGLAAELARAEGIPVEIVVVADDVALRDTVPPERRRGIAGTVLVHKIAGAMAARGARLEAVAAAAREAAGALGTMGVALGPCTVPAAGRAGFTLGEDEIELGLGIHGEPGVRRARLAPADELAALLVDAILADRAIAPGAEVALLVNGLGGTPPMELAIMARAAIAHLRRRGLAVVRAWQATLLSALEMPGCSITLLAVDAARCALLDAATGAPAWPGGGHIPARLATRPSPAAPEAVAATIASSDAAGAVVLAAAGRAGRALVAAEARLTELDGRAGDGDLGISMRRAAEAVAALGAPPADAAGTLVRLADTLRRAIGGSSGPFYAAALMRAAQTLARDGDAAAAFTAAVDAIAELGGARQGDRTMLDALAPAAAAFGTARASGAAVGAAFAAAAAAARRGADATARLVPRLGRAAYLGERALGVPDAGAEAIAVILAALADAP